jgi:hypothetical protein
MAQFDLMDEADDDLMEEEEDDSARMAKKAEELTKRAAQAQTKGMVRMSDFEGRFTTLLRNAGYSECLDDAVAAVTQAAKATCLVRRHTWSDTRTKFHQHHAQYGTNGNIRARHKRKLLSIGGKGNATGLLISPCSPLGWIVVTNNHAIMSNEEAATAEVVFDYDCVDGKLAGTRTFKVQDELVASSLRTAFSGDESTLDYSLLALQPPETDGDKKFLEDHGVYFEETARIQAGLPAYLSMVQLNFLPLIMFSHPLGLAKRFSCGPFPALEKYPATFIEHELPTLKGSSGGNLLFSSVDDRDFTHWNSAFLHYRRGRAVAWQAIGPDFRVKARWVGSGGLRSSCAAGSMDHDSISSSGGGSASGSRDTNTATKEEDQILRARQLTADSIPDGDGLWQNEVSGGRGSASGGQDTNTNTQDEE